MLFLVIRLFISVVVIMYYSSESWLCAVFSISVLYSSIYPVSCALFVLLLCLWFCCFCFFLCGFYLVWYLILFWWIFCGWLDFVRFFT